MIDFRAWEPHFVDHLAPIWHALEPDERGAFVVPPTLNTHVRRHGITPSTFDQHTPGATIVVASYQDLKRARAIGPVVYMEHGAGQTYEGGPSGSYIGGGDRDGVVLTLLPGPYSERAFTATSDQPYATVGCPKLDAWLNLPAPPREVVGITWHWDCRVNPETRSAFMDYRGALRDLHRRGVNYAGHSHPRAGWRMKRLCEELGHDYLDDLADLMQRCGTLVADNTSALYEFAALDRPVVVLNARGYRRHVHHGLRFWSHIPGEQVDRPDRLHRAITHAITDDPHAEHRRRIVADVYANLGTATAAAVEAIRSVA